MNLFENLQYMRESENDNEDIITAKIISIDYDDLYADQQSYDDEYDVDILDRGLFVAYDEVDEAKAEIKEYENKYNIDLSDVKYDTEEPDNVGMIWYTIKGTKSNVMKYIDQHNFINDVQIIE